MKKYLLLFTILFMLSFSLCAQNKKEKEIDAATIFFPIDNAKALSTNEAAIQLLSKKVADYLAQLHDSSLLLKDFTKIEQSNLFINCLFVAGEYEPLPALIVQYRKESSQKLGKALMESYAKAAPYQKDNALFKSKYESFLETFYKNSSSFEDLPVLEKRMVDEELSNSEDDAEAFKNALSGDTVKSINLQKAINIILTYVNVKFSVLNNENKAVYKKQISRLQNSKENPIASKFKVPISLTAIVHVNVVNVISGKIDADQVILIDKNTITLAGSFTKIKVPPGTTVIDATGKYAMPGMTDGHIHFSQSGGLYSRPEGINIPSIYPYEKDLQWRSENMYDLMARYLACGVTNVIDVGGAVSNFNIRERVNNEITSPNALVTGPLISTVQPRGYPKDNLPFNKASTPQEARELVKMQIPLKPDFIKIWYLASSPGDAAKNLAIVKAAIDETHANGLKVCVHATEFETARLAVLAGADILVHSIDDKVLDEPMLKLLKSKIIAYIPTLQVADNWMRTAAQQFVFSPHDFKYANPFMLGNTMDLQHINPALIGWDYKHNPFSNALSNSMDSIMAKNLLLVSQAGINIVAGTDAGNPGTHHGASFLKELQLMKAAGLSEIEIIRSATINAAKGFGKQSEWGSIEKNKIADILLLDDNPLISLAALDNIKTIIHRGVIIETAKLLSDAPEVLVQQQLNAYNARDMEAFLVPYSDSVELYDFPNKLLAKGKAAMQTMYAETFKTTPELHCEIVKRIVLGNTVIDHERVSGKSNEKIEAIAEYEIENGKIKRVYFKN